MQPQQQIKLQEQSILKVVKMSDAN